MEAAIIHRYGRDVEIKDVPMPTPGPHDVVIRVAAAAINPVDWKIRDGMLRLLTGRKFPKILGSECAGEVVDTGSSAQRFRKGDHVMGYPGIRRLAAYAQYVSVPERTTFPKPAGITFEQASTLPIAGLTALQALRNLGHIAAGHEVLINGAAGGVGHFAVQVARIFGARVTAVCSGAKADLVQELGADRVIDYTTEDFTSGTRRYDIIFDAVSKRSFADCKRVLSPHGRYVNTLPTFPVLVNQYLLVVLTRQKAATVMVKPNSADMELMRSWIEADKLRILIDKVYPLAEIGEAFAYSETGKATGKVVLKVGQEGLPRTIESFGSAFY